jgi:hypothetical protein
MTNCKKCKSRSKRRLAVNSPDLSKFATVVEKLDKMDYERYSPSWIVEGARRVMGAIDLDPSSCDIANQIVQADRFYTRAIDGLRQPWRGRIFLNPPFGKAWKYWIMKLGQELAARRVQQAFVIGPHNVLCSTDSPWFRLLWQGSLLLPFKRLAFLDPATGKLCGPKYGSFCCYLGPRQVRFARIFGDQGTIVRAVSMPDWTNGRVVGCDGCDGSTKGTPESSLAK